MPHPKIKGLRIYSALSRRNWPRGYVGKIMLVAFVGTHIPLLALLAEFLLTTSQSRPVALHAIWLALAATLSGTAVTLFALNNLLQPIRVTCQALRGYLSSREIPSLPTEFTDEAGVLMADTQHTIDKLDAIIRQLSFYDDLTGLPNRMLFQDRLGQAAVEAQRHGSLLAVLIMDVVGLKNINEMFGREIGDLVLQSLADRIGKQVRESDVFARIGDNEFGLIQTQLDGPDTAATQAQRLMEIISSQPFVLGGHEINVQVVIGIATFPNDASSPEELLWAAEAARHQAREQKVTSGFCFYDTAANTRLLRRLELESDLRTALDRKELQLHYQPQICNKSGRIIGTEALLRWTHPTHGPISPAEFIPIAEKSDLILHLGEWVLRTACLQNKSWQEAGLAPLRMAVNLSARQFQQPDLVERVAAVLSETNLEAQWLELEVTESVAMEDAPHAIMILQRLRDLGITLSLDDFGTGYSSLSQLKRLPIDTLKIDRAFVQDVTENAENASIADAIISLARSLQLEVIAEGVETEAQFDFLKSNGCGLSQGYYFSRPVSPQAVEALLRGEITAA